MRIELMVDDAKLSQKHVNLLQPVVFYAAEGGRPVELVINKVTKDHVHGYVKRSRKYANRNWLQRRRIRMLLASANDSISDCPATPEARTS